MWVQVNINDGKYMGIITKVYESCIDIIVYTANDRNFMKGITTEDVIGIDC
jgi:hypothetical protein